MDIADKIITQMQNSPNGVRFVDFVKVCKQYFGRLRIRGSHYFFKTPWKGEPFVNIQEFKSGKAKAYQVRQVLDAIKKLEES